MDFLPVGFKRQLVFEYDPEVSLADLQRQYIKLALKKSQNMSRVSKQLGIDRNTLRSRSYELGIEIKPKVGRPGKE